MPEGNIVSSVRLSILSYSIIGQDGDVGLPVTGDVCEGRSRPGDTRLAYDHIKSTLGMKKEDVGYV